MPSCIGIEIDADVQGVYSKFEVDGEKLVAYASDPDGPIALTPQEAITTLIEYDAKSRVFSDGSTAPSGPLAVFRNIRAGLHPLTTHVKVGTQTISDRRTPEEIEHTTIHELVHVRQLKRHAISLKIGLFMQTVGVVAGSIGMPKALEAITNRDFNAGFVAVTGIFGAISGWRAAYQASPHEIEARRVAKHTPYMDIVTGTVNPNYESFKQREDRKDAEKWERLLKRLENISRSSSEQ